MSESAALESCYPISFISNSDKISTRLQVLSNNALLESIRRFRASVPSNHRTKIGLTKLIMDDFRQHTNELMRLSTEDLRKLVSPPDCARLQLPLVCQLVRNRYGSVIASHLLCDPTRWDPPEATVTDAIVTSVHWLQVPLNQLKSRLSKVELDEIKACCDLYLSPELSPKSKTGKYSVVAERFRSRSVFLFSLPEAEFLKNYLALLPHSLSVSEASRQQLVEEVLKEEFGHEISEQLLLPLSSERKNGEKKQARRENRTSFIANACEARDTYIRSWPQPVPKDVVFECVNAYCNATQLKIPSTCSVCSRQQFDVEMHQVLLTASDRLLPAGLRFRWEYHPSTPVPTRHPRWNTRRGPWVNENVSTIFSLAFSSLVDFDCTRYDITNTQFPSRPYLIVFHRL